MLSLPPGLSLLLPQHRRCLEGKTSSELAQWEINVLCKKLNLSFTVFGCPWAWAFSRRSNPWSSIPALLWNIQFLCGQAASRNPLLPPEMSTKNKSGINNISSAGTCTANTKLAVFHQLGALKLLNIRSKSLSWGCGISSGSGSTGVRRKLSPKISHFWRLFEAAPTARGD